jgi:putative ABC transport system permease protein
LSARAGAGFGGWPLAFRLARRELRGGVRSLRIVLACLALGVAAIAAVGTLRTAIDAGLRADGARLLGGDVELRAGSQPVPDAVRGFINARAARTSDITILRSLLVAPSGERLLVEVKAVDAAYPLLGTLLLDPAVPLRDGEVAVEPLIAERLGLKLGDELRLGEAHPRLVALLRAEPDKAATPAFFGPRVLATRATLDATGLIQPGSLLQHSLRVQLPPGGDAAGFVAALRQAFPDEGLRLRTASTAEPGFSRFMDSTASFLVLAGLTALLVGGIGVATGVRAWLEARARTIATMRCLGAPSGLVLAMYLVQLLALSAVGIIAGLVAGYALTWLAAQFLAGSLPVPPRLAPYPGPLALAALYGLLTALAFALWPLGRAARIPGAALFRDAIAPEGARPGWGVLAAQLAAAAALIGLVVATAGNPRFAAGFCAAALATLGLFRLGAAGLMLVAGRVSHRLRGAWRLGLANLHRPGAPTALVMVSLGIGLTTLTAIAQIEGNLRRQVEADLPKRAPNFFFVDIQQDQLARFDALVATLPGVEEVKRVPNLRARITALKGVPVAQVRAAPGSEWALAGDRGLTYSATPPEGARIVTGAWWAPDYRGAPLVSLDASLAEGWNVGIGDVVTLNILGRDLEFRIANTRAVNWRGMGMNFALVASPGVLEAAPHSNIATVRGDPALDATVLRSVTDAFPNVTGVRVRDALETVAALLSRVATALTATASLTLASGVLVLGGAVAAGQRRRVRDAVVLKVLGATRGQISAAWAVEFGLVGATSGLLAAVAGCTASWAVMRFMLGSAWVPLWGVMAATLLGCLALALGFGRIGTALALRARPAGELRGE